VSFELGAVVLPAEDGQLFDLGVDVKALEHLAIGVVIEEGSSRSYVHFPELKMNLWLDHSEVKDVLEEAKEDSSFSVVKKLFEVPESEMLSAILIHKIVQQLKATHILEVEHGALEDLWQESSTPLSEFYQGSPNIKVMRIALGLEEYFPARWEQLQKALNDRVLFTRFLPSGMYKFELSLYLKN
jgi:hypothetical protein